MVLIKFFFSATLQKMLPKFNSSNWNDRSKAFEDLTA